MSGSPRSNNGSSVTSPSRPTASPAAYNSHLQQQQQQHQYQQQPRYGMPLSSQPVHTTTAAASSTAATATAASAASTAAAAVPGSSSQPGQQSNFVSTGPYQYQERIHNRFNNELNSPIPPEVYANLAHTIAGPNTWYLDSCCGQHMCSSETRFIVNRRCLENPVVVTVANNQRLTAHWMGSIVLDSVEEEFSLHLNEVLLVPRLGFNLMSSAQLMRNGITLLGEPGKFTLKYGEKKLGTAVEQNGVFVLNFVPERTTADSDNILSLGPWEHRDDIDYTDETIPREGVVPTSSTTAAAVMLTLDAQGLNDVENSWEYMAAVAGWGDTTNMPTDDGVWGAAAPDETTWGETPAERATRLLAEAEQRVAEMEILDSGRLVGVEPVPAASDQESGELVLAPGEYVDVEVRVPPPNLTRYVAPAFDQIRSDGHQLLLSFFANAEYYLRAQGHKATGETWHKRLGHPSQSTLNNTIKAAVLDKNSLLLPSGLELKPVNRPAPCTICPAVNLPHEPFPTHFPGADDYQLMDMVYSDILNLPEDGFNGERYVITFTDASTRYVWTRNMTNRFLAFTAFRTWLPLAERESDTKLKAFQCDGGGEYRSTEFTTYLQERGIRRLFSLPHAHQQSGVAERLNTTLQEKMRALLAQAQLGPLYWPFAMDHATLLHNLLSSSALPKNASPHLLWTGKLGTTKLLRVFGCVVQYRPPTAPLGKFDQRAKWGLHLGIEKQYFAWRIMDYRNRLLFPARGCIFYQNLTLPVFEQHLASQQNPALVFHGVRSFANVDVELAASEEPDSDGAREAAPDPPVPVTSSGIPEFIPLADAAPEDVREVHHTYLVDEQCQPMPVVSNSSIRVNLDEIGGASGDQNDFVSFAVSGVNVSRTTSAIHLTASKYAESLAKRFNIPTDFVATPYRSTLTGHVPDLKKLSAAGLQLYQQQLGCLLFAAVTCRPDLAYVASHLAQFLRCPKEEHSLDLQRALRYFVSTPTLGLIFNAGKPTDKMYLSGYVDADHGGDTSDRRSRTGDIFRLEPIGPISWNSSKQELVSLSSAEAKFIATCAATREGLYLQELLDEAKFVTPNQFTLQCDNQSAITIANNPGFVNRTKHISLRYFFVKDAIDKGRMRLIYCPTSDMAADSLTKKLTRQKFHHCNQLSGISEST
ncbi:unnamed protein product, partial [Closterium sp. NIES-53]